MFYHASLSLLYTLLSELLPTLTGIRPYDVAHNSVVCYPFDQVHAYKVL